MADPCALLGKCRIQSCARLAIYLAAPSVVCGRDCFLLETVEVLLAKSLVAEEEAEKAKTGWRNAGEGFRRVADSGQTLQPVLYTYM